MAGARTSEAESLVQRYYDANTRRFLAFGQGGNVGAIHRGVRGPGVTSRAESFNYVNELVLRRLRSLADDGAVSRPRVVDLGCGVGASLIYLAERHAIDGLGITLSTLQAEIARTHFERRDDLECVAGTFLEVPVAPRSVDAA